jgi:hypothetical protein
VHRSRSMSSSSLSTLLPPAGRQRLVAELIRAVISDRFVTVDKPVDQPGLGLTRSLRGSTVDALPQASPKRFRGQTYATHTPVRPSTSPLAGAYHFLITSVSGEVL